MCACACVPAEAEHERALLLLGGAGATQKESYPHKRFGKYGSMYGLESEFILLIEFIFMKSLCLFAASVTTLVLLGDVRDSPH